MPSKKKPTKKATTKKAATAKTAEKPKKNKSTVDSPVAKVWEIAGRMPDAPRKDVIAACVAKGINFHAARTPYQRWLHSE
jgi:hypothetical protein